MPRLERFPQSTPASPGERQTAAARRAPRCLHVRSNCTRCGSPALAQRDLCYFHNAVRDRYRGLPLIEDATSIQLAVMRVLQLINTGAANYKETGLMLYALQIAAQNLRSVRDEQALASEMVRYDPQDRDQLRDYQAALASGALALEEGEPADSSAAGFVSGHEFTRAESDMQDPAALAAASTASGRLPEAPASAAAVSLEGAQLQLRRQQDQETPRARESATSGRTERASLSSAVGRDGRRGRGTLLRRRRPRPRPRAHGGAARTRRRPRRDAPSPRPTARGADALI